MGGLVHGCSWGLAPSECAACQVEKSTSAVAITDSDAVALREAKAEAWDEGAGDGAEWAVAHAEWVRNADKITRGPKPPRPVNPYRETAGRGR